jgi:cardiolipin synthase
MRCGIGTAAAHALECNRASLQLLILAVLACASTACTTARLPATSAETAELLAPIVAANGALNERAATRLVESRLDEQQDDPHIAELIEAFRHSARAPLIAGNQVTLLIDGPQALGSIRHSIERANHHVHLETYIFADDEIGREFRDLLIRRQREGIEVRVIYDAVGSIATPAELFASMRDAGVEVREFRPIDPVRTPLVWKVHNRDHRKIVVVDGRIAFTGGINISSTYESSSSTRPGPEKGANDAWRDTHVRIEGPVARQFQALFLETWTRAGGSVDVDAGTLFPVVPAQGRELVAAVASDGEDSSEVTIYATYLAAIEHATQRIWLTNAYFAPNRPLRKKMIEAARRGVDVRLIVPGFTDSGLILYASRSSYDELLEGGVRIFEQRYALLHAKTAVIDSALSMVGSANLDMRSFLHNNEVNAVVIGADFAQRLEAVFERDLRDTRELQLSSWRDRSLVDKLNSLVACFRIGFNSIGRSSAAMRSTRRSPHRFGLTCVATPRAQPSSCAIDHLSSGGAQLLQPASRTSKLDAENRKAGGNHDECGPGEDNHQHANQHDRAADECNGAASRPCVGYRQESSHALRLYAADASINGRIVR